MLLNGDSRISLSKFHGSENGPHDNPILEQNFLEFLIELVKMQIIPQIVCNFRVCKTDAASLCQIRVLGD